MVSSNRFIFLKYFILLVVCLLISGDVIPTFAASQKDITKIILPVSKNEALLIAKKYYGFAHPKMEADLAGEFNSIVSRIPNFDQPVVDTNLCKANTAKVAGLISYTNAKYFYLSLASALFSFDTQNLDASVNMATAIATYLDEMKRDKLLNQIKENELLNDAFKIYCYSIILSAPDGIYNRRSIVPINCLGNLLLDMKRFDDAFVLFNTAHSIDRTDYTSITGMYNYYMIKKNFKEALRIISENARFAPVFTRATSQLKKQIPTDDFETGNEGSAESELEKQIEVIKDIPVATSADFIEELDPKTAGAIRKDVKSIQDKMVIKAPNLDYILMIKNYENMSREIGQSAILALTDQIKNLIQGTIGYETEAGMKKQMEMLKQLGVNVDLGMDVDNLQNIINDAMKNPDKYENWEPNVKISGINNISKNVKDYQKKLNSAISKAKKGEPLSVYEQLAKTMPEFKIMLLNPYLFSNPNDLLIQRYNVLALSNKKQTYQSYLKIVNVNAGSAIAEILQQYQSKIIPLTMEYQKKLTALENKEMDEDERKVKIHQLHVEYYPRFNRVGEPYWNQATEIASVAYKKIRKYSSMLYKDCMKHIMLISDSEIRDKLDEDIRSNLITDIKTAMNNVLIAFNCAPYHDVQLCDCDLEEIRMLREKIEKESHERANAQIEKNMQDKKNFDEGILDENSKYYKEFIAKYEYEINVGFLKSKVNPYKSKSEFAVDLSFLGINFSISSNHLKNTTTYDGGISLSAGILKEGPGPSLKSGFGFTATKGSDGNFDVRDVDIRASVEGSLNIGVINVAGGVEASAIRGTREYANASLTGDKYLDELKGEEKKLKWLPGISKEFWSGSYQEEK